VAVASANVNNRTYYEEKFFNWLAQHKVEATVSPDFSHIKLIIPFCD